MNNEQAIRIAKSTKNNPGSAYYTAARLVEWANHATVATMTRGGKGKWNGKAVKVRMGAHAKRVHEYLMARWAEDRAAAGLAS